VKASAHGGETTAGRPAPPAEVTPLGVLPSTSPVRATNGYTAARTPAPASLPPVPSELHFNVGGSIYSDTPADRMLILNGQVFHEGDHPASDVRIDHIGQKAAVLDVRGTQYQLVY
jgi:general secretion pathway protein B